MPIIRKIEIRNFRCLRKFDWLPSPGINCLIGPGDSGKSSILDAIDYCLGARRNLQLTDADFHNLDVTQPITVAITLGQLDDALKNVETYGQYLGGFNTKTDEVLKEPEAGQETILTVLMTVEGDLEPKWTLASERAAALGLSRGLNWADRQRIAPTRLGGFAEYNLSWRRGSILNRISEERPEASAAIVAAARDMRAAFGDKAKDQLTEALKIVADTARDLGIPVGPEVKAMLDAHSVSVSGGAISLHDIDGIPLKNLGVGSARLLVAGLQRRASERSSIVIVDELEYGLEPHRIIRLVDALGAKEHAALAALTGDTAPPQAFMTTHSPVAIRELSVSQLFIMRDHNDQHVATCVGSAPDVQGTVRLYPEALLAPSVLVCEGASEVGLMRGLDRYFASNGKKAMTACGTALVDGVGTNTFKRALAFQTLGYRTAVLRDSDQDMTPELQAQFSDAGGTIFCWSAGYALEDELFQCLSETGVSGLLERAILLRDAPVVNDHLKSVSANKVNLETIQLEILSGTISDESCSMLAAAAKCGAGWFKNITAMEGIAHEIIGPDLGNCGGDLDEKVRDIFCWIADEG